MAADLEKLVPDLKSKVSHLIEQCLARGIEMRANNGLRDPFEQARLWRQSRAIEEIAHRSPKFGGKSQIALSSGDE